MRRRIEGIADGSYRTVTWTEWDDEFYEVPCTLTVEGDHLIFDFTGASPQTTHFFNSKPYIIEASSSPTSARSWPRTFLSRPGCSAPSTSAARRARS